MQTSDHVFVSKIVMVNKDILGKVLDCIYGEVEIELFVKILIKSLLHNKRFSLGHRKSLKRVFLKYQWQVQSFWMLPCFEDFFQRPRLLYLQ